MNALRSIDLGLIDEVFRGDSGKGWVLDFSNRTFSEFFARELDIDIDAPQYAVDGDSKGKRFRCFLAQVDNYTVAKTLRVFWEYREALRGATTADPMPRASGQIAGLIGRLEGTTASAPRNVVTAPLIDMIDFHRLRDELMAVRNLEAHERGYAFERFLTATFEAFRLRPREPFRLMGEQIDGSFELANEIYLVEAKWLNRKVGVAELHTFHGKVDQKAAWARGVFVSFGGFTDEGLHAFGKARRVVGVEGKDLYDAFDRGIGVDDVIARKVRHAAETGEVFAPVSRLFP
jgi:hypothetical protein